MTLLSDGDLTKPLQCTMKLSNYHIKNVVLQLQTKSHNKNVLLQFHTKSHQCLRALKSGEITNTWLVTSYGLQFDEHV